MIQNAPYIVFSFLIKGHSNSFQRLLSGTFANTGLILRDVVPGGWSDAQHAGKGLAIVQLEGRASSCPGATKGGVDRTNAEQR